MPTDVPRPNITEEDLAEDSSVARVQIARLLVYAAYDRSKRHDILRTSVYPNIFLYTRDGKTTPIEDLVEWSQLFQEILHMGKRTRDDRLIEMADNGIDAILADLAKLLDSLTDYWPDRILDFLKTRQEIAGRAK